ncbi:MULTISPECIES: hypothetical protein, partial [Paenibacillus]|uniref:hypothetical protein n=1 Tax=Paenibacillus TaxID=44249 RepID=UPI0022B86EF8
AWQKLIAELLYLTLTRCSVFKGQFVSTAFAMVLSGENQCSIHAAQLQVSFLKIKINFYRAPANYRRICKPIIIL